MLAQGYMVWVGPDSSEWCSWGGFGYLGELDGLGVGQKWGGWLGCWDLEYGLRGERVGRLGGWVEGLWGG